MYEPHKLWDHVNTPEEIITRNTECLYIRPNKDYQFGALLVDFQDNTFTVLTQHEEGGWLYECDMANPTGYDVSTVEETVKKILKLQDNYMANFNAVDKFQLPDMSVDRDYGNLEEGTIAVLMMGNYIPPQNGTAMDRVAPPAFDNPGRIGMCRVISDNKITITDLNEHALKVIFKLTKKDLFDWLTKGKVVLSPTSIIDNGKKIVKVLSINIIPFEESAHQKYFANYYNLKIEENTDG